MRRVFWALFGNDDDGVLGDTWWNPTQKDTVWGRVKWWFRNPLHNLMFYVPPFGYGTYDMVHQIVVPTWYGKKTIRTFVLNGKQVDLSFREFKTKYIEGYIGHRERGNFGIALRGAH